jgi:hypothetical protein
MTGVWNELTVWQCTGFRLAGKSDANMSGRDDLVSYALMFGAHTACVAYSLTFCDTSQIEKYGDIDIPIVLSEYGAGITTKSARTFTETATVYSPEMTDVFSGGCVYEFWQGSNAYGLALLERKDTTQGRLGMPKAGKIVEKRESDLGTTLLFEDFMNYKAQLAALPQFPVGVDVRQAAGKNTEEASDPTPWKSPIERTVPESCLDWPVIEDELKRRFRLQEDQH